MGLSSTSGRRWEGHYGGGSETINPMSFKLYLAPPPLADAEVNKVYFRGESTGGAGSLEGASDTETVVVIVLESLEGSVWNWRGVITLFGMVGVWGTGTRASGWWWNGYGHTQEWSERSP